jgi:hypothetical protein
MQQTITWLEKMIIELENNEYVSPETDVELSTQFRTKRSQAKIAKNTIDFIKAHEKVIDDDVLYNLADILADEAFGKRGLIEYSARQVLSLKFFEMLKSNL